MRSRYDFSSQWSMKSNVMLSKGGATQLSGRQVASDAHPMALTLEDPMGLPINFRAIASDSF